MVAHTLPAQAERECEARQSFHLSDARVNGSADTGKTNTGKNTLGLRRAKAAQAALPVDGECQGSKTSRPPENPYFVPLLLWRSTRAASTYDRERLSFQSLTIFRRLAPGSLAAILRGAFDVCSIRACPAARQSALVAAHRPSPLLHGSAALAKLANTARMCMFTSSSSARPSITSTVCNIISFARNKQWPPELTSV